MFPIQCNPPLPPQLISMFVASHGKHLRKPQKITFANFAFSKLDNLNMDQNKQCFCEHFQPLEAFHMKNIVNIFIESGHESQGCSALRQSLSRTFPLPVICWASSKHCFAFPGKFYCFGFIWIVNWEYGSNKSQHSQTVQSHYEVVVTCWGSNNCLKSRVETNSNLFQTAANKKSQKHICIKYMKSIIPKDQSIWILHFFRVKEKLQSPH